LLEMRVTKREKKIVWGVSIGIGVALGATTIVSVLSPMPAMVLGIDQLFFIALVVTIFPPAMVEYVDMRWKASVDKNLPEFLRELAEAGRTGITLTRAIDLASKRRYGPLSSELQHVSVKLSWGGDLVDALKDFADRIDTRLARRVSVLLSEVHRSGGEIKEVLEIVSKHARELQTIEQERSSQLKMYVAIIYIAFFVFLFIDFLLLKTFFAKLASLKEIVQEAGGLFAMGDLESIKRVMFHMCVIEGLFGGLVAGKMGENALGAGLKHAVVLMSIAIVMFYFFM